MLDKKAGLPICNNSVIGKFFTETDPSVMPDTEPQMANTMMTLL